jgi:EAL domain-containing protein (putative c-di-GMP-specific phosphodiesterase class I)
VDEFDLVDWILQGELVIHYQPKVCLRTGRVAGVEVLARLRHPTSGLLSPDRFIPFAESRGMIAGLTDRIFDAALQHPALHHPACRDLNVAFNLSPLLLEDLQLPDRLESRLGEIDFQPERLVLEVTEACTQKDQIASMDVLARLRLKGFQLSIDDFGTGFSSLLHLYRLPFGELKIDKSFVSEARSSDEAATIVSSTVGLAHSLGLKVVAEGIENWATLDWLKDLRCDQGQGYHMSPPVDGDRLVEWLEEWHGFVRPGIRPM